MNYALKKAPRSGMNNRRVAGAVHISAFIIHYIQTKHTGVYRPGGEALIVFSVFSVFSVDSRKNFVSFRAIRGSLCIRFKLLALSFQL
jgi:hypothetical protein